MFPILDLVIIVWDGREVEGSVISIDCSTNIEIVDIFAEEDGASSTRGGLSKWWDLNLVSIGCDG
jgi:small nuclear ribonucleoprotein (snRNP)-like protein